jgi:hypothetical protein
MNTSTINLLNHIKTRDAYREAREHIFPSESSLEWFIRKNRPQLVAAKALLSINGRVFVNQSEFDGFLLELGQTAHTS